LWVDLLILKKQFVHERHEKHEKVNPFVLIPSVALRTKGLVEARHELVEWDEKIYAELNDFYAPYQC